MSTTTTHTATVVPLAQIHVVDGANPRRRFDEAALRELADSIAKHGMIQPLVVHPNSEGYVLIAGERRYRAASLAGLDSVPVTIRDENESRLELAVDENLHRQALDPIEEAHAFQAILQSGKLTKKQLAERVSKSPRYVNERMRLLALPEAIQAHIATGAIPVRLAKQLIETAKVSEPVAVACTQLVATGAVEVDDLEQRPERVIGALGDFEWPDPQPIALLVSGYHRYPLDSLPLPSECGEEIRERYAALGEEVGFRFDEDDADAARSYGCLLEFQNGNYRPSSFITDPAFIADRVRLKLDQHQQELANRARKDTRQSDAPPVDADQEVEQRRLERQQRAQAKKEAVSRNFELGRKLQLRYDAPKITAPLARLLALLILDGQAEKLAGRGVRYTREDWQIVEESEVRGKPVSKARYPHGSEAAAQLYASIARARTPEQIIGRLLQALLAAHTADDTAVAISTRIPWNAPGQYDDGPSGEIPAMLDRLAKPVLPQQLAHASESEQPAEDTEAA